MNQYHIYEKIGKGKHSTVYKGRKKKTIQYHAIKSVDKSQKPRVMQEVRTMHALNHRNILKFYAWYETQNHLWLILEYCVGGDLMSLLRQDARLPESSIHDFGRDMVVALQFLHASSVIYCDVKPSNILLDENGRLKLGGFGLSRRLSDINRTPVTNLPPAKRGTPCYMAPELFSEGATHSTASDLWSLGCVLYECATGSPPFMHSSFNQLVHDILNKEPAAIPGASAEFSHLLFRLLDKNPATRIKWPELVEHPFWQAKLPLLSLPPEPALEAFIKMHKLAPTRDDAAAASEAVRSLRESVDLSRLSRIALSNLEKDDGVSDYTAAQPATAGGDITIDSADAELDFEEAQEEGFTAEEDGSTPSSVDDGNVIDQSGRAAADGSSGMVHVQQQHARAAPLSSGSSSGRAVGQQATVPKAAAVEALVAAAQASGNTSNQRQQQQQVKVQGTAGAAAADAVSARQEGISSSQLSSSSAVTPPDVQQPSRRASSSSGGSSQQLGSRSANGGQGFVPASAAAGAASGNGQSTAVNKPARLVSLIWHASDSAVKPIVANRRIERLPEPIWDRKSLPFEPLTLQQMLDSDQVELESFLTQVYRTIASSAPVKDKVNVLAYFESLCSDTAAANVLINSSLTVLFVRMLRNGKTPLLRIRLASVLGLLIRHATYIADELAGTQLVEILTEALQDKSERVRRRVMATLGELLFYVATQQQDSGSASVDDTSAAWGITPTTIAAVTRLMRQGEDEVCQHYAVKTVENICSQGGEWACKFASTDVLVGLMGIYGSTKTENVKATTASTLSRLLRNSPNLISVLLERWGPGLLLQGLTDSSSKVQVASINMLNLALSQPDVCQQLGPLLLHEEQEQGLLGAVSGLLDHSLPLLRAKAIVTVILLCRLSPVWLLKCCQQKLVLHMERLMRDRDTYTQDAIALFRQELAAAVNVICSDIDKCFSNMLDPQQQRVWRRGSTGGSGSSSSSLAALDHLYVVQHLVMSPSFRPAVVDEQLIQSLSDYLLASTSDDEMQEEQQEQALVGFRAMLLQVLEALSQPEHMALFPGAFLQHLMPALCRAIVSSSSSLSDTRFFCLRIMSDCLAIYLTSPDMYEADGGAGSTAAGSAAAAGAPAAAALDELLQQHVVPLVPALLQQEDPMPLYALKLLGGILDVNSSYVSVVEELQLSPLFFDFLTLEHPNNNVHNIRLCRQLLLSGCLNHKQLLDLRAADKVCAVLCYAQQNNVEPFLEPVLLLAHALMARDAADMAMGASKGELLHAFMDKVLPFMDLCTHTDTAVAVAAALCLAQLAAVFPAGTGAWLLSNEGAGLLASALQGAGYEGPAPPAALQQHLLSAVNSALAADPSLSTSSAELAQLMAVLRGLGVSEDAGVAYAAAAAAERLGNVPA